MTGEQLAKHRAGMGLTQEGMVELLGCSLIGHQRRASYGQLNRPGFRRGSVV